MSVPGYGDAMSGRLRLLPVFTLLTLLLGACTADPGWPPQQTNFELIPAPVNAEVVVGQNRMLFNIYDR